MKPETKHHLPKVVKGLSCFIDHWERSLQESIEYCRLNEPPSYYWHDVRDALSLSMEDEFIEEGDVFKSMNTIFIKLRDWNSLIIMNMVFMVKMIILLDIGVIVQSLHFEVAVIFMLVILLH